MEYQSFDVYVEIFHRKKIKNQKFTVKLYLFFSK